jgi:hypothetical protein
VLQVEVWAIFFFFSLGSGNVRMGLGRVLGFINIKEVGFTG